jgi:hypothetical protein
MSGSSVNNDPDPSSLVRIERRRVGGVEDEIVGFVVARSEHLLVVHRLSDRIDLDGYEGIRTRDVTASIWSSPGGRSIATPWR